MFRKILLAAILILVFSSHIYPAAQHPALQGGDRQGGMSQRQKGTPGFSPGGLHGQREISVRSTAFSDGDTLPDIYRGDRDNISPPIEWSGIPAGTKGIVLICDDPDAPGGRWSHWVVFNIPPLMKELPEGMPRSETLPNGARQGINDFKRIGYYGPTPPSGVHRYYFRVYALDAELKLNKVVDRDEVLDAMAGHVLASGEIMALAPAGEKIS